MPAQPELSSEVRARALFGHRVAAIIVRVVIVAVALRIVLASFLAEVPASDLPPSPAHVWATIAGALIATACGALALLIRRNRRLRADIRRIEDRAEELADRNFELKESEERARSLLEAQEDVIVRRDSQHQVTYANDAFCALTGQPRASILGDLVALPLTEQGEITIAPDGTRVHDQRLMTALGERWIAWREVPVRDTGHDRTEILSVGRDVTERAEAEHALAEARDQAEAANRAKSRFLAMVSHEIRTPLNGILGMAELLRDTTLTPEQASYVRAVKVSGDTLLSLIEEILDFSKIEAGRLDLEARPFELAALVEEVVELLAPRAQAKGLEIASYVDEGLPRNVIGDAARLRQVLLNLAGNAIKFTPAGSVAVIVEPGAHGDEVALKVCDTGIGIAADARDRIFLEFEQADATATRKFGGTGLGLAITKRIIERMGGDISLDSEPRRGSTFQVSVGLPRAEEVGQNLVPRPQLAGRTIMIVAPACFGAQLLARRLEHWSASTYVVEDPQVAATLVAERRFDAILVDRAVGTAQVRTLMSTVAGAIRHRLILLTPADRHELSALCQAGYTGYLVKPVRTSSLAARFADQPDLFEADVGEAADAAAARAHQDRQSGLLILVAEDNPINALLARALLTKLGHRAAVAVNGTIAVETWLAARAAGTPYDAVLMDLNMPELDGIEATRQIRAAEAGSAGPRTLVIALTANACTDDREQCLAAGMDGFLTKPLDRDQLAAMLAPGRKPNPLAA